MADRLQKRRAELDRERQITAMSPVLKGAALVIPQGLLRARTATLSSKPVSGFSEDPAARAIVEHLAMEAVIAHERGLGNTPRDVSAQKKGWDVESRDGTTGHLRFIEVKGRHAAARDVIVTKNEMLASLNLPDAYHLALVLIDEGFAHEPVYVQRFVDREPGFAETAVVFSIDQLQSLSGGGVARRKAQAAATT
jgi:hypothetical protein